MQDLLKPHALGLQVDSLQRKLAVASLHSNSDDSEDELVNVVRSLLWPYVPTDFKRSDFDLRYRYQEPPLFHMLRQERHPDLHRLQKAQVHSLAQRQNLFI